MPAKLRIPVTKVREILSPEPTICFTVQDAAFVNLVSHMEKNRKWTGLAWWVTMARPRKPRSTGKHSQNAHLNGHVQSICEWTGNNFDTIKRAVKMRAVEMGLPFETLPNGDVDPMSEADMDTEQCALCIDAAHQIASEWGIELIEEEE